GPARAPGAAQPRRTRECSARRAAARGRARTRARALRRRAGGRSRRAPARRVPRRTDVCRQRERSSGAGTRAAVSIRRPRQRVRRARGAPGFTSLPRRTRRRSLVMATGAAQSASKSMKRRDRDPAPPLLFHRVGEGLMRTLLLVSLLAAASANASASTIYYV